MTASSATDGPIRPSVAEEAVTRGGGGRDGTRSVESVSTPTYTLQDGTTLPAIGFGTYPLKGEEGVTAIGAALAAGYRLLDTAVNYENEAEVGEALRRSGVPRDEVRIQTKIPG